jgi:predicted  nucleic acid-binding Zn-ribbon protein
LAEKIPGWIERLLLPRLSQIEGELKAFRGEANGEFKAIHSEIKRLETKIDGLDERLNTRINSLSEKVDVIRDIEKLKVEVAELKKQSR